VARRDRLHRGREIPDRSPRQARGAARDTRLRAEPARQWIDCGTAKFSPLDQPKSDSLVADLTVTITDMRDSVSVFVDLTAIANTLVLSGNSRHIVQHACRSNGRFERELLERLRATSP
jgi:hypothetical protein